MFEQLGLGDITPREASVWLALALGLIFGLLAEPTRFCFRRAVAGPRAERRAAGGLWLWALGFAILGTQGAVIAGLIDFGGHRYTTSALPILALVFGGLAFGIGMVLTRGCITRLTILSATGNLRALVVMVVFAIVAHATLKGVLAPLRLALGSVTVDPGIATLSELPGGALVWGLLIAVPALAYGVIARIKPLTLIAGAVIGLLIPAAWVGTGYVLLDEFDPIALESLAFTATHGGQPVLRDRQHRSLAHLWRRRDRRRAGWRAGGQPDRSPLCMARFRQPRTDGPLPDWRRTDGRRRCSGGRLHHRRRSVGCAHFGPGRDHRDPVHRSRRRDCRPLCRPD